ncbi:MAG: hypothetical protein MUP70_05185 [Candidatus Aminicenantes bacterium]|nr:hypothetical protein [Candidatus Aminicenantes bacterium]
MPRISFKIDDYTIKLFAVDKKGARKRWGDKVIQIYSGGKQVAQAVFGSSLKDIPEPYFSDGIIYYFAPADQFEAVTELLRSARIVYIAW